MAKLKFKRSEVTIRTREGRKERKALVNGGLAIHTEEDPKHYVITHIDSGAQVCRSFHKQTIARDCVADLQELVNWDQPIQGVFDESEKDLLDRIAEIRDRHPG